jgi:hypothetical protein
MFTDDGARSAAIYHRSFRQREDCSLRGARTEVGGAPNLIHGPWRPLPHSMLPTRRRALFCGKRGRCTATAPASNRRFLTPLMTLIQKFLSVAHPTDCTPRKTPARERRDSLGLKHRQHRAFSTSCRTHRKAFYHGSNKRNDPIHLVLFQAGNASPEQIQPNELPPALTPLGQRKA